MPLQRFGGPITLGVPGVGSLTLTKVGTILWRSGESWWARLCRAAVHTVEGVSCAQQTGGRLGWINFCCQADRRLLV